MRGPSWNAMRVSVVERFRTRACYCAGRLFNRSCVSECATELSDPVGEMKRAEVRVRRSSRRSLTSISAGATSLALISLLCWSPLAPAFADGGTGGNAHHGNPPIWSVSVAQVERTAWREHPAPMRLPAPPAAAEVAEAVAPEARRVAKAGSVIPPAAHRAAMVARAAPAAPTGCQSPSSRMLRRSSAGQA
ncbi:hypothetical protein ACVWW1_001891 [Bradyrhizobium sp. JR3.5]